MGKYQKKIRALKKYGEKISCTNKQIKKKSSKLFIRTYVCVKKNLAMKCDRKKNPTCLTGTKKNMHKKIAQPPPLKNLMVRPLTKICGALFLINKHVISHKNVTNSSRKPVKNIAGASHCRKLRTQKERRFKINCVLRVLYLYLLNNVYTTKQEILILEKRLSGV